MEIRIWSSVVAAPVIKIYRFTLGNNPSGGVTRNAFDATGTRTESRVLRMNDGSGTSVLNQFDGSLTGFIPMPGAVSPVNPLRLAIGLSGVYESVDAGATWTAVTPGSATGNIGKCECHCLRRQGPERRRSSRCALYRCR